MQRIDSSGSRSWAAGLRRVTVVTGWILVAIAPGALMAQASSPVPLDDRSYEILDRLAAQLAPGMVHGQRPYTRAEFARLIAGMEVELGRVGPWDPERVAYLRGLLDALADAFDVGPTSPPPTPGPSPAPRLALDRVRLEGSWADSPFRGFTWNGLGAADDALVNPLLDYGFGRELADGATVAADAALRFRVADAAVLFAEPRAAHHAPRGGSTGTDVGLRVAAARASFAGWSLQIGRSALRRGQGREAGSLFSNNAPPVDMIFIENEALRRLPWVLGALGPWRFSAHFIDLGPEQNYPHAKLYGNWIHFLPLRGLEIGGGFVVHDGGEGAPEQSLWRRIGDYLMFVDVLFQDGSDFEASNKVAGVDFRLTLTEIGVVGYGELYMDDFDWRRPGEILWPDAAHLFGIELPRLDGTGRIAAWAEYHHVGIRMYRHYDFSSGLVKGRFLLGNALGSDASAWTAGLDFVPTAGTTYSIAGAWDVRKHDEWTAVGEPGFHFEKVADRPRERRLRLRLALDHRPLTGGPGFRASLGAERVRDFGFEEGSPSTNAALHVELRWAPRVPGRR